MLNNTSIKSRLVFVISLLSAIMLFVGVLGLNGLSSANQSLKTVYQDRLICLGQMDSIVRALNRNQLLIAKAISADPARLPEVAAAVDKNSEEINRIWSDYAASYLTPDEKALAEQFSAARKAFLDEGVTPAVAAAKAGDVALMTKLLHGKMEQAYGAVRVSVNALIELQKSVAKQEFEQGQLAYGHFRLYVAGLLSLGALMAAAVGGWLVLSISRPLDYAVAIARRIADGDLTQHIAVGSRNETGRLLQALKEMNASLMRIVGEVRGGTDAIAAASSQIASGNLDLSSRTEQQAGSLEETASSMEELTSTVRQNADNARQADQLARSASAVALEGGTVVARVVDTMSSINDSARKIVDIISVIDGIAFQTNILALNAAVEAARAGEQGRGFAVVASEVRNLAQRSAGAAKEIKTLIGDSVEKVEAGSKLVGEAGQTMRAVVDSVQRVSAVIGEISSASLEQSAGIDQINQAITQMDEVTQQNAALVEEAAAAAAALQDQADGLARVVSVFKVAPASAGAVPVEAGRRPAPVRAVPPRLGHAGADRAA